MSPLFVVARPVLAHGLRLELAIVAMTPSAAPNSGNGPLHPEFPLLAAARPLEALAADINQAHQEAQQYASQAVERALQAGDLLLTVKARLAHGEFGDWCQANLPSISTRQLQRYMKVARALPAEKRHESYLSLNEALRLVAGDSEPEPSDQNALWYRAKAGYLATILRDMKRSFRATTTKFTRFCTLVLLMPEPLAARLLDDDVYQTLARDTVRYELTYGAWDGFDDLCTVIDGLLADVYGDADTEARQ